MSATRGRDDVPHRPMTSSAASSRRRTSLAYSFSRLASVRRTMRPATSSSGSGIAFLIARIIFWSPTEGGRNMAWDFETDPEYQKKLDWVDEFVRQEGEALDLVFPHQQFVPLEGKRREAIDPLKEQVRAQGLWATHLGPELGGQGY